jgi:uncharacterized protein (TIGR00369 family)
MVDLNTSFARQFVDALPHAVDLGLEVVDIAPGRTRLRLPYDARLIGDPETRVIAGGAVSALLDTCCGLAVIAHPDTKGVTATLDLRIDYMRAAVPDQPITAEAVCHRVTRSIAFVRAQAWDADENDIVATASGAFTAGDR